jgi:hypothetical protein
MRPRETRVCSLLITRSQKSITPYSILWTRVLSSPLLLSSQRPALTLLAPFLRRIIFRLTLASDPLLPIPYPAMLLQLMTRIPGVLCSAPPSSDLALHSRRSLELQIA